MSERENLLRFWQGMASRRARRRAGHSRGSAAARSWAGRIVIGLLVLVVVAGLGGYFWLQNYLRSDGFRRMVNLRVSETLEVEAAFDKFKWDGMELTAPNFNASGDGMIRRIDLQTDEPHRLTPRAQLRGERVAYPSLL